MASVTVLFDRLVGRRFYRLHRRIYQLTGGRIGHRSPAGPILLLTTTGRRTGRPRTTPLLYLADPDADADADTASGSYLVVASNGGRDEPPDWLRNLEVSPDARVRAGRATHPVRADVLRGHRADVLWPRLTAHNPAWRNYQRLTEREIPVVRLTRRD
ncbi:MAG: nitroreductase/quinone reductase family protein [Acidimicrobiales bacterium]